MIASARLVRELGEGGGVSGNRIEQALIVINNYFLAQTTKKTESAEIKFAQ